MHKPLEPSGVVNGVTIEQWLTQAAHDTLRWHQTVGGIPEARLADFKPGFDAGWRECIKTLKLHNIIKES